LTATGGAHRRKRILLDIDGVVADLVGDLCTCLREIGFDRQPENVTKYAFDDVMSPQELSAARAVMGGRYFCQRISWYLGGEIFIAVLRQLGEVVAVTKPFPSPTWAYEREVWLKGHVEHVIHTGAKEMILGNVLIEDCVENAVRWLEHHPGKTAVLIERPWNRYEAHAHGLVRVKTFTEALDAVHAVLSR